MTVKQEQNLIDRLEKLITVMDIAKDHANKLGAYTTESHILLHAKQGILDALNYHKWHIGEVTKGNIID